MDREEIIKRLCKLCTHVGNRIYHNLHAHDCFCDPTKRNVLDPLGVKFEFNETILLFIEEAVDQRIDGIYN